MKKVLTVCLMALVAVSMCVSAFAATNGFVSSPSGNSAPALVSGGDSDVNIYSYSERDKLPEDLRQKMESAYAKIVEAANDLTTLNTGLADLVKSEGVDAKDLAVSDLFDLQYVGTAEKGQFDLVIKSATFDKFFALLHLNGDTWELVKDAKVENKDGEYHLSFSVEEFSPFAVVVNTAADSIQPEEDSNTAVIVIAIVGGVIAVGVLGFLAYYFFVIKKKQVGA